MVARVGPAYQVGNKSVKPKMPPFLGLSPCHFAPEIDVLRQSGVNLLPGKVIASFQSQVGELRHGHGIAFAIERKVLFVRKLGINRDTVGRYIHLEHAQASNPVISTAGNGILIMVW